VHEGKLARQQQRQAPVAFNPEMLFTESRHRWRQCHVNRGIPSIMGSKGEEKNMLRWAALFLIIAVVAGLLGFAGIAGAASNIAWIVFVLFLILFVVSLFLGNRSPV
jgi:uncharacterized membrane protein YtjA (UPF0391 family)